MAGRIIERRGLKFEIWDRTFRLVEPRISPMVCSFNLLTDDEKMIEAIDEFIQIMNIGIDIHEKMRF